MNDGITAQFCEKNPYIAIHRGGKGGELPLAPLRLTFIP